MHALKFQIMSQRNKINVTTLKSELFASDSTRNGVNTHPPTSTRAALRETKCPLPLGRISGGWERVAVWMQAAFDRWGSQASCSRCSKADERMHLCIKCTSRHVLARALAPTVYIFMPMYYSALAKYIMCARVAELGSVQIQSGGGRHLAGVSGMKIFLTAERIIGSGGRRARIALRSSCVHFNWKAEDPANR